MFIINLTYLVDLEIAEKYMSSHQEFMDECYKAGYFIVSGRKIPRTGGVILSNIISKDEVEDLIKKDPFYINKIAKYDIIEFMPTRYKEDFKCHLI